MPDPPKTGYATTDVIFCHMLKIRPRLGWGREPMPINQPTTPHQSVLLFSVLSLPDFLSTLSIYLLCHLFFLSPISAISSFNVLCFLFLHNFVFLWMSSLYRLIHFLWVLSLALVKLFLQYKFNANNHVKGKNTWLMSNTYQVSLNLYCSILLFFNGH